MLEHGYTGSLVDSYQAELLLEEARERWRTARSGSQSSRGRAIGCFVPDDHAIEGWTSLDTE
jgi:hypothetical protein